MQRTKNADDSRSVKEIHEGVCKSYTLKVKWGRYASKCGREIGLGTRGVRERARMERLVHAPIVRIARAARAP